MRVIAVFFFLCLIAPASYPQSGSLAERAFLNALNELVTNTIQHHWHYDEPMQPDSLFHLAGDTISITWRMNSDSGWVRIRLAAPVTRIKSIDWDYYLVMNYSDEAVVRIYEQTHNQPEWRLVKETHLLHIAVIEENNRRQMKKKKNIERAFERMAKTQIP